MDDNMDADLHSRKTAVKIVAHIAKDIRCQIFSKVMKQGLKMYVIVDEASTISCKHVLIIYVKVEDYELSPTILDLLNWKDKEQKHYTGVYCKV